MARFQRWPGTLPGDSGMDPGWWRWEGIGGGSWGTPELLLRQGKIERVYITVKIYFSTSHTNINLLFVSNLEKVISTCCLFRQLVM